MTFSGKLLSLYKTCQRIRMKNVVLVSSINHQRRLRSTNVDVHGIEKCKNEEESSTRSGDRQGYVECLVHSEVNIEDLCREKSCTTLDKTYDDESMGPFDECTEDLSFIGPYIQMLSFSNLINASETAKRLVDLNVNLYKIKQKHPSTIKEILQMKFEQDIQPYISFLLDLHVPADEIGHFITIYPEFLTGDLNFFATRVRYLKAHMFTESMITTIIRKYPRWLSFSTDNIDGKLCYVQNKYNLNGLDIRILIQKQPKLVSLGRIDLETVHFTFEKELGLKYHNIRSILINTPSAWLQSVSHLRDTYNYAFFEMGLSADYITTHSEILLCRMSRLKMRHEFLVSIGRAQYDPKKPLYVWPGSLCSNSDDLFCNKTGYSSVLLYDAFLKTI